jgi:hypothetical protein
LLSWPWLPSWLLSCLFWLKFHYLKIYILNLPTPAFFLDGDFFAFGDLGLAAVLPAVFARTILFFFQQFIDRKMLKSIEIDSAATEACM